MNIELIKENTKGTNYKSDDFMICYRYKDTITGDNNENPYERIYLITGKAEITLGDDIKVIEAPFKIEFPANTYHKIYAISDISFILFDR